MGSKTKQKVTLEDLVITRIIDAPIKKVWEAWTVADKVMCWWGPKDYTSPKATIDLRVGGKYSFLCGLPRSRVGWTLIPLEPIRKLFP
jgi:uncharacterized protein YndB with AHSA1/START domain